jgi:hypothetical protein
MPPRNIMPREKVVLDPENLVDRDEGRGGCFAWQVLGEDGGCEDVVDVAEELESVVC